jgi:hypothetical protein
MVRAGIWQRPAGNRHSGSAVDPGLPVRYIGCDVMLRRASTTVR